MARSHRTVAVATAVATLFFTGATAAQAAPASPDPNPEIPLVISGDIKMAKGWTDVSTLNIVKVELDTEMAQVEQKKVHLKPAPTNETVHPTITQVDCGNRIDWYRIINTTTGATLCFADAGEIRYASDWGFQADLLCPGNNTGQTLWAYEPYIYSTEYWSILRDGHSNWNTCYSFGQLVWTHGVRIL